MQFPDDVPVLTDGRVTLRAPTLDDVPGVVEQCNDPLSVEFTTVPVPYGEADATGWISSMIPAGWDAGTELTFAIEYDGRFAGSAALRPDGDGNAEIAYGLAAWARGKKVVTGAVRLLLDWGFGVHGYPVIHWRANVGNWGSRRVAWATGFHFGPTIPKLLEQRGDRYDAWTGWIGIDDDRTPTTTWLETPVLETDRIRLRLWRDDEAERLSAARTNDATLHFLPFIRQPFDVDAARRLLAFTREQATLGTRLNWCVADKATDLALGNVTVFHLDDPREEGAEVGYWAHTDAQGRGVMSEALRTVADWCFTPGGSGGPGLRRLLVLTAATNKAARRVAENAGFAHVGTERRAFPLGDGTMDDRVVYDLLAPPT